MKRRPTPESKFSMKVTVYNEKKLQQIVHLKKMTNSINVTKSGNITVLIDSLCNTFSPTFCFAADSLPLYIIIT